MSPIPTIPIVDPVTSTPIKVVGSMVVLGSTAIWWPVKNQDNPTGNTLQGQERGIMVKNKNYLIQMKVKKKHYGEKLIIK